MSCLAYVPSFLVASHFGAKPAIRTRSHLLMKQARNNNNNRPSQNPSNPFSSSNPSPFPSDASSSQPEAPKPVSIPRSSIPTPPETANDAASEPSSSTSMGTKIGIGIALGLFILSSVLPLIFSLRDSGGLSGSDIKKRLGAVPVFSITDKEGKPYLTDMGENKRVGLFFLDSNEAESQLDAVKSQGITDAQVLPVALDQAMDFIKKPLKDSEGEKSVLDIFELKPKKEEVDLASSMIGKPFDKGVPVFYMEGLSFMRDGIRVYPVFFNYEELQSFVSKAVEKDKVKGEELQKQEVNIIGLSDVLDELKLGQNPLLKQVVFYPPEQSVQYMKSHK